MYLEAKETAKLYTLLSDKLGGDTTEAMFKYIDNKTERAVENTIQSLATKEDLFNVKQGLSKDISDLRVELSVELSKLRAEAAEHKSENTKGCLSFGQDKLD